MFEGLQHIGIYCYDIEESAKFYTEVLGFDSVFRCDAMEGDKPLKIHFIKHPAGFFIELLEQEDKSAMEAIAASPNHVALRVKDADAVAAALSEHKVEFECRPFTAPMRFQSPIAAENSDVFTSFNEVGTKVRIFFFRGPNHERFEVMADDIGGL